MYKRPIILTLTIIWAAFIFFMFLSYSGAKPVGEITKTMAPMQASTTNFLLIGASIMVILLLVELIHYSNNNQIHKVK